MKTAFSSLLALAFLPLTALAANTPSAVGQTVIPIPGGTHGISFDDIGYVPALHRVTIPAGATGNLVLIDPANGKLTVIKGVSATPSGHPRHREGTTSSTYAEGYLFATDHDPAEVVTINPRSGAIIGRTPLASDADYVRYVARTHEIWVTEPDKQQIQVFQLAHKPHPVLTPKTTIHIADGPESLEIDNHRNRAYANLWQGKTVVMALTTHKVLAEWPNTCKRSHGIAIDAAHDHVFVGCGDGKVVTLDAADHGKLLASAAAGAGIDAISYSPKLHHLYVPGARAATLTIFDVSPTGALKSVATRQTAAHAHCVTNDNAGHVFVCDPRHGAILDINDQASTRH
ncbi:MAG TPA: hypothetical protein VF269_09880 [Rhodanobacteraceae bacterium]